MDTKRQFFTTLCLNYEIQFQFPPHVCSTSPETASLWEKIPIVSVNLDKKEYGVVIHFYSGSKSVFIFFVGVGDTSYHLHFLRYS